MSGVTAVSVIVPCRNECRDIERFIRSVLAQQPPDGGFEVIVADGTSDDGTREILERLALNNSALRVIDNPERIVSTGLNRAIRAAKGSIVIRADVHTEYASDYLRACVSVLQETGGDNVGGPWIAARRGYVGAAIAVAFQSKFGSGGARSHDGAYEGPVDTVYLGCWRREVVERIGYFDEELVRNQDDELNLRLHRAGGVIWQSPRIRSRYYPRASLRRLFQQYSQYGYWKVRVIQKHRLPASWRHVVPAFWVLTMLILLVATPVWRVAGLGFALLGSAYVAVAVTASVVEAARSDLRFLPVLPLAFACLHIGYGAGFLKGIVDFLVLRRIAAASMSTLTRA